MKAIRKEIKRILDSWDPLSLRGLQGFHEEYNKYVGPLSVMVKKNSPPGEIAAHLHQLMTEEWKLPPDRKQCYIVAEKIQRAGGFLGGQP
jgi:hypothetical protein